MKRIALAALVISLASTAWAAEQPAPEASGQKEAGKSLQTPIRKAQKKSTAPKPAVVTGDLNSANDAAPAGWPPLPSKGPKQPVGPKLFEPHLHVAKAGNGTTRVALTFDACMGKTDPRILDTLVSEHIPATIFVTARWLRTNPEALAVFMAHPDQFELENHGQNHIPPVDVPIKVYGIPAAGSPEAVAQEVKGGADAMIARGISAPRWFRGATAKYDRSSITQIRGMGYRIAGYSINGDSGSLLPAAMVEKQYARAKDGDVIISHINQPTHAAGEGVVKGILALKARGTEFVRLQDFAESGDDDTTN